jgi:hypothetical protein
MSYCEDCDFCPKDDKNKIASYSFEAKCMECGSICCEYCFKDMENLTSEKQFEDEMCEMQLNGKEWNCKNCKNKKNVITTLKEWWNSN